MLYQPLILTIVSIVTFLMVFGIGGHGAVRISYYEAVDVGIFPLIFVANDSWKG